MNLFIDKQENFKVELNHWYVNIKRNLPWRTTKDPYKIWLSEIILQQTRVNQGLNYYLKFVKHYPTVIDLACATEEEVLKDWQGLGYYSRARNLHATAKYIANELKGEFPTDYKAIKELKGVGDYTAAAIASFAFNLPHAVVDGNVYRVLSRIFGIDTPIDSTTGKKEFSLLAQQLLDLNNPGEHNQAIMEFGAVQCAPKSPNCKQCIFNTRCHAYYNKEVDLLPVKAKKIKQKVRHLNYFLIEDERSILVHKRTEKGIWQNLYDFPLVESDQELMTASIQENPHFKALLKNTTHEIQASSTVRKHVLSHQILLAKFFHLKTSQLNKKYFPQFEIIKREKLNTLPVPKLIENYLNEETNLLSLF